MRSTMGKKDTPYNLIIPTHLAFFNLVVNYICSSPSLYTHLPIVEYLWNLSPGLICAITTQAACAECKCHTIRALNSGHASISIGCTASVVSQAHGIFNIFLHNKDVKHVYNYSQCTESIQKELCSKLGKYI